MAFVNIAALFSKMNLPPYPIFPNIIGDEISLRQIIDSDLNALIDISYYNAVQATTFEEALHMNAIINNDYNAGNSIHWGITLNNTNTIIGTCGFYRGFDNEAGELGCVLLPQYIGKGYMNSALKMIIHFGLNHIGLKRIWANTSNQNEKAIKLLSKLHFIKTVDLNDGDIEFQYCAVD